MACGSLKWPTTTLPDGSSADVYATINNTGGAVPPQPDTLSSSTGTLTINSSGSDGGTFDSNLTVNADLIFVKPGTDPANRNNDVIKPQPSPGKKLVAVQVQYNTTPPPGYPGCLPADVFYVYQIAGAGHPHVVKAATTTCGGAPPAASRTGKASAQPTFCICKETVAPAQ